MPELLKRSKCRALCKLVYYVPGDETHASNRLIYHIKRNNDSKTPRFLSAQLLPVLSMLVGAEGIDVKDCVITYVPRSRRAYLEHGTDQSKELARCLGEDLGMPTRALIKRDPKSNQAQKTLTPIEREKNARESFLPMGDECFCEGKSVFLVDDVVTTGASMARCVRLLRKMGARRVWCICIASDHVNRDLCVRAEI